MIQFFFAIILSLVNIKTSHAYESFDQMATSMSGRFHAPIITIGEIQYNNDFIFLDAREVEEFEISHIKNAIHIGYDNFDLKKTLQLLPKSTKVIVYCSVGYRSGKVTQILRENSIEAYNLYGGIFHWINEKRELENIESNPTTQIHGYNASWSVWITYGEVYLPPKKSLFHFFR